MVDDGLHISIHRDRTTTVVLRVSGELDLATVPALEAVFDQVSTDDNVVIDGARLTFIDSTGLEAILRQWDQQNRAGGSLRVRRASAPLHYLLELTKLTELLEDVARLPRAAS